MADACDLLRHRRAALAADGADRVHCAELATRLYAASGATPVFLRPRLAVFMERLEGHALDAHGGAEPGALQRRLGRETTDAAPHGASWMCRLFDGSRYSHAFESVRAPSKWQGIFANVCD